MYRQILLVVALIATGAAAQEEEEGHFHYKVEMQGSASDGNTPLWLNANKHGLSSIDDINGYLRAQVQHPVECDSDWRWGYGYGVDLVGALGYDSKFIIHQAWADVRWLHGMITVGSKEQPMQLKNQELSSGSQTLGINARPVPQVRLSLPEYYTLPIFGDIFHLKGHIAFGKMTDGRWAKSFTEGNNPYNDGELFHSKAGYLKIENETSPLSVELGLEMACIFGGTYHLNDGLGTEIKSKSNLRSFWNAFWPGGSEANETTYQNVEGDHLGSWVARVNYNPEGWGLSVYADKFFEDHSGMVMLDYDGYGTGDNWNVRDKRRYLLYDLKDIMLGVEVRLPRFRWANTIVAEYIYTKYQSGPVYHDHSPSISDHIGGVDNYYNHSATNGWKHWGRVMGNALFLSPIYNDNGSLDCLNNRFKAIHLGISGDPLKQLHYRLLFTWQDGLGTYSNPYTGKRDNVSMAAEAAYKFKRGWAAKCAIGFDHGTIYGNNTGAQLTISKSGLF